MKSVEAGRSEQFWDPPIEGLILVGGAETIVDLSLEDEPCVPPDLFTKNAIEAEAYIAAHWDEIKNTDSREVVDRFWDLVEARFRNQ